jgi:hypothetical protein
MKLLVGLLLFSGVAKAECHGFFKVNKSAKEANVSYLELPKDIGQKFCLDMPHGEKAKFVEISTVNLGNASCSDVRMTVNPPGVDLPKLKSKGSQPGTIGVYKGGRWVVKLILKDGCNKYKMYARWY